MATESKNTTGEQKANAESAMTDVLDDLMQTLEDGAEGYEDAAGKLGESNRPDLAPIFRTLGTQRKAFHTELGAIAVTMGHKPLEGGTVTAKLHRGWMGIRDVISGSDPSGVLAVAEQGESHAESAFEAACKEDLPAGLRTVVEHQLSEIRLAHTKVRRLSEAA